MTSDRGAANVLREARPQSSASDNLLCNLIFLGVRCLVVTSKSVT